MERGEGELWEQVAVPVLGHLPSPGLHCVQIRGQQDGSGHCPPPPDTRACSVLGRQTRNMWQVSTGAAGADLAQLPGLPGRGGSLAGLAGP